MNPKAVESCLHLQLHVCVQLLRQTKPNKEKEGDHAALLSGEKDHGALLSGEGKEGDHAALLSGALYRQISSSSTSVCSW